jgi:hypothetical protein
MVSGQGCRNSEQIRGSNSGEHHIFENKNGTFRTTITHLAVREVNTFPTLADAIKYRDSIISVLSTPLAVRKENLKKYQQEYLVKYKERLRDPNRVKRKYIKKIRPPAPPPTQKRLPKQPKPPKVKKIKDKVSVFSNNYPIDNRWSGKQVTVSGPVIVRWD